MAQKNPKYSGKKKGLFVASWARCEAQRKGLGRLGKKMSRQMLRNTNAEQKTGYFAECDRRQAQSARQSE